MTHRELGDDFEINRVLAYGSLPKIFSCIDDSECEDFLTSYGLTYLNEEVWAEHLIQDLDPFRKFLEIAAQCNGKVVNFAHIAFGAAFEHLVIDRPGMPTALVEIKSSQRTDEHNTRYLRSLAPSLEQSESFCLSLDPHERVRDGVNYLPWQKGLAELGL